MSIVYSGRRFKVEKKIVKLPNGLEFECERVVFPRVVVGIPVLEGDKVVLVRQYRPSVENYVIEAPAGVVKEGEDELEALKRELYEEVGAIIEKAELLFRGYTSPGYSTELMSIYLAYVERLEEPRPEPHEVLERIVLGIDDALRMIQEYKINDLKTVASLLLAAYRLKGKRSC